MHLSINLVILLLSAVMVDNLMHFLLLLFLREMSVLRKINEADALASPKIVISWHFFSLNLSQKFLHKLAFW